MRIMMLPPYFSRFWLRIDANARARANSGRTGLRGELK
jgi:hypothetical protein